MSQSGKSLLQFTVSEGSGPPAGVYKAVFSGVDQTTHDEYGLGVKFSMTVSGGPHDGKVSCRTTRPVPSATNVCGRLIASIIGRPMAPGENIDLGPYVGKIFTIVVTDAPNGKGTRLESVVSAA
jgi:hypothetical protein